MSRACTVVQYCAGLPLYRRELDLCTGVNRGVSHRSQAQKLMRPQIVEAR